MDLEKKLINMKDIFIKHSNDIKEDNKHKINNMLKDIIEKNEKLRIFNNQQSKNTLLGL